MATQISTVAQLSRVIENMGLSPEEAKRLGEALALKVRKDAENSVRASYKTLFELEDVIEPEEKR